MSSKVTVSFKTKWLWLILGIILVLIAVSPVVSSYLPAAASSPSSNSGGSSSSSGSSGPAVNCANPCTIVIQNSIFGTVQPTVVKAGTTITWVNKDDTVHTSTSNSGIWNSGIISIGSSFSFTFSTPGTYPYHCNVHPMTGTIVVVS
jgi:plastocyanin